MPASRRRPPSHRYAPTYAQPASLRRRRRRRAGRARLAVLLVLVAALAVLLIVATSSGTNSNQQRAAASEGHTGARASNLKRGRGAAPHHPQAAAAAAGSQAVDKVLAYTPFVKGGLPRHRVIALTFDDGPSPYTPQIVSELVRLHVPATFFVVGQQLNDFSSGLRDEVRHGFAVGDHTENHVYMTQLSAAGQYRQLHDAAVRMERLGAPPPVLFRPPYGSYDAGTLAVTKQMHMLMTLWSADTRDWMRPGTLAIVRGALSSATPGGIILMHDGGGDRSETVAALPAIINALRRRHYGFVTVPQLLQLDPPPHGQRLPHVAE